MTTLTHRPAGRRPPPSASRRALLDPKMLLTSLPDALRKLDPR